jgi:hypothetical protein
VVVVVAVVVVGVVVVVVAVVVAGVVVVVVAVVVVVGGAVVVAVTVVAGAVVVSVVVTPAGAVTAACAPSAIAAPPIQVVSAVDIASVLARTDRRGRPTVRLRTVERLKCMHDESPGAG